MADLSNLFSSMILPVEGGTPEELDPRIASLLKEKERLAGELQGLKPSEDAINARMGVNPEQMAAERMAQDKPKGFWKTLGKFATEGLNGAVNGRSYTPYSERVRNDAMKDYQLESGRLGDQLTSITSQKNRINQDQAKLEQAAALMGVKLEDLGVKKGNAATAAKRAETAEQGRQDKLPLLGAQVNATNALGGLRGAQASLTESKTAGQDISNVNNKASHGLTGTGALMNRLFLDPKFADFYKGLKKDEINAKAAAKPAGGKAAGNSFQFVGAYQDPETGNPMAFDKKSNSLVPVQMGANGKVQKVPTGAQKDSISRAVSGYSQVEQLEPLIDRVAAKGKFGGIKGVFEKYLTGKGVVDDPDLQELMAQVDSVAKFSAGIHGSRAYEAMKDIYDKVFALATSPETMKAGLRGVKRAFAERANSDGAIPRDWESVKVDPQSVHSFLEEGMAKKKAAVSKAMGANTAKGDSSEPSLDQIRAEVERRRKMKAGK